MYGPVIEVGLQLCPALQAVIQGSADRLGGEPDGVGDHRYKSRRKVVQAAAFSVGQFTLTLPRGCWISRQIVAAVMFDRDVGYG